MSHSISFIDQSVSELHRQLMDRSLTSVDLVRYSLAQIRETDPVIRSFLTVFEDSALAQAEAIDVRYQKGDNLPLLAGIPISIKDNICMKGQKTTCASQMLADFVSPYQATVMEHVFETGLIPVGKVNLDEFAMGSSTENSAFQVTVNPWDEERVSGGSSGGSAASVAAGQVPLSLGSDTGGSIRQPAAFCGVMGLKPTYGRVSRYGLVAFASSLDQIGPFGRCIEDVSALLSAICGHDPRDATSSQQPVPDFLAGLNKDVKGLRIAVPEELFNDVIDPGLRDLVAQSLDRLKEQGATWDVVSMSSFRAAMATYYIIAPAEASANLSRYDGVRYTSRVDQADSLKEMIVQSRGQGFGEEVKRRILLGTFALSSGYYDAYYLKAQKARVLIRRDFERIFQDYDVIASPTTPSVAFKVGEKASPLEMYLADVATIPANMAGLPALSQPCGFVDGLPVGLQWVGPAFNEQSILNAAYALESVTDFHRQAPERVSV